MKRKYLVIRMRDKERIKRVLDKLEIIWNKVPDQRFFQMLFNYTMLGTRTQYMGTIRDPFHYEDDEFEEQLDEIIKLNNM